MLALPLLSRTPTPPASSAKKPYSPAPLLFASIAPEAWHWAWADEMFSGVPTRATAELCLRFMEASGVKVLDITGGAGVPVVYDAVGADAYEGNLRALAPRGWFVNYGHASGPPPIDALELNQKSLIFTKASMKDYVATPEEKAAMMDDVVAAISDGTVKPNITGTYELADIAEAHTALDSRTTTGALVAVFES